MRYFKFSSSALLAGFLSLCTTAALSADLLVEEPAAAPTKSTTAWIGGEGGDFGFVGYLGLVTAFNGDINSSGALVRFSGAFADIEYTSAGTDFDLDKFNGDLMLGYQAVKGGFRASLFAGVDAQDNDVSPNDPNNSTIGSEIGFKVQGEFTASQDRGFLNVIGNYSTAHDTYYTRGRLGLKLGDSIAVGPEGSLLGNSEFDGSKVGGFISGISLGNLNLTLNGGYQQVDGVGSNDGAYGGAGLSLQF